MDFSTAGELKKQIRDLIIELHLKKYSANQSGWFTKDHSKVIQDDAKAILDTLLSETIHEQQHVSQIERQWLEAKRLEEKLRSQLNAAKWETGLDYDKVIEVIKRKLNFDSKNAKLGEGKYFWKYEYNA
mmetsp:Transcript_9101/g.8017  ORF Transcript_9101/g.8017 Transcript_9101/m.8017 type:complete len:129 (+) Transcript_9101:114-500(+)